MVDVSTQTNMQECETDFLTDLAEAMQNLDLGDRSTASAHPDTGAPNMPCHNLSLAHLLQAPLEIRHKIYSHFLLLDAFPDTKEGPGKFNWKILSVCRQVREEVWQYLCTSNKWIQFAVYTLQDDECPCPTEEQVPFTAPLQLFPKQQMNALVAGSLLTIRIGHGCGLKKFPSTAKQVHRVVFAYNESSWIGFCTQLSEWVEKYRYVSFDLSQRYKNGYTSLVLEILIYLMLVRRAERARFTPMMH